jgi:UDP-N-acetylglucosamine transferase subunit ALG13
VIFVTVGSQMPFRRLVQAVDEWAQCHPAIEVLAQVGSDPKFHASAMKTFESVPPARYVELVRASELVVAHAGMGSVLTALEFCKPMVLMPRRGALHETRNDHQLATLRWLTRKPGIYPAEDEQALKHSLDLWCTTGLAPPSADATSNESMRELVHTLRTFIG